MTDQMQERRIALIDREEELRQTVCACIGDVVQDLKSEYREAIEQVDLAGATVEAFPRSQKTSSNNASVRLHRARKAVEKELTSVCGSWAEHQCLDCTCPGEVNCMIPATRASAALEG
ncbi:MAG: hypothetical protein ABI177_06575 [Edaphobacter sp.]